MGKFVNILQLHLPVESAYSSNQYQQTLLLNKYVKDFLIILTYKLIFEVVRFDFTES